MYKKYAELVLKTHEKSRIFSCVYWTLIFFGAIFFPIIILYILEKYLYILNIIFFYPIALLFVVLVPVLCLTIGFYITFEWNLLVLGIFSKTIREWENPMINNYKRVINHENKNQIKSTK